jgi:hypothetical protein
MKHVQVAPNVFENDLSFTEWSSSSILAVSLHFIEHPISSHIGELLPKGAGADEVSERFGRIELFWEAMGMKANRANPTFGGLFYVFPQRGIAATKTLPAEPNPLLHRTQILRVAQRFRWLVVQSGRDRIPIPFSQFEYRRNPNT